MRYSKVSYPDRAIAVKTRMKTPPLNTSKEACALRVAALAFANHRVDLNSSQDEQDRRGQRFNIRLLKAAVDYAKAISEFGVEVSQCSSCRSTVRSLCRACSGIANTKRQLAAVEKVLHVARRWNKKFVDSEYVGELWDWNRDIRDALAAVEVSKP